MTHPVKNKIGGMFVPVRDAAKARDWYRGLLGLPADPTPIEGHLCVVPLEGGRDLVLDEMPEWGGDAPDGPPVYQTPAFMFDTDDIHAAHAFMREYGGEIVTDLNEFGQQGWFAFRDPDGNLLMVCGTNPNADGTTAPAAMHADGDRPEVGEVRLVEAGPVHAVGLVATCAESELSTAVPRLWGLLADRLHEVPGRLEPDRQLSVFLGRRGEVFTEFVGVAVLADTAVPDGMIRIDIPAGSYAVTGHSGSDVQASYQRAFGWAAQHGRAVLPHEQAFHHLERYREPVLRDELEFDIWVRLQTGNPAA